jgi:hypothetical protein
MPSEHGTRVRLGYGPGIAKVDMALRRGLGQELESRRNYRAPVSWRISWASRSR